MSGIDITATHIMNDSASLGEALRRLRKLRGITLRELARRVGVSAPFVSDLEHDRRKTNAIAAFAAALEVDAAELGALSGRLPASLREWLERNPRFTSALTDLIERAAKTGGGK